MKVCLLLVSALLVVSCSAFQSVSVPTRSTSDVRSTTHLHSTRRDFIDKLTQAAGVILATNFFTVQEAVASGGATAGGAYLLSAKQRYNERVTKGITGFLALRKPLEGGDVDTIRTYFNNEDAGSWKDLTTAGYLLANAFRRNSTAAPDSLPSVKAWKAFAAEVESMTKSLKKKDTKTALEAYERAVAALDTYLERVELPLVTEMQVA
jgi:hypothetical protein